MPTQHSHGRALPYHSHLRHLMQLAIACLCLLSVAAWSTADSTSTALTGTVTSASEGTMEGVVVIARPANAGMFTAVTTGADGKFVFPSSHLQAGEYQLSIRAVGYTLAGGKTSLTTRVTGDKTTAQDLRLAAVQDPDQLASQLTSLEWINSFPGTDAQKSLVVRNMVNCHFCHSLERVARSSHDATEFLSVIQRMKTYETDHSSATRIQRVSMPEPTEGLKWYGRRAKDIAEYFASINLSDGRQRWDYPLRTLPRPGGKATRAIVTVYPVARPLSVIHDLDVDSRGNVWYGNTGWDYIGWLDPQTGEQKEWEAPNFRPPAAAGVDRIVGVQDIQVDPQDRVWAAVGGNKHAVFIPDTESWQVYDLPVVWKNPFLSPVRNGEDNLWATGLPTAPDGDNPWPEHAYRLDTKTGRLSDGIALFDGAPPPQDSQRADQMNYCYMMDQDKEGNFLCTAPEASAIVRANDQGEVRLIATPTPHAYPRRGTRDDENRFWFSEFFADKLGVIDLDTDKITEYDLGIPFISPYYSHPDNRGRIWISSTGSDRLLRFDPATGELVQYLMPVYYDARKVVVDLSADHTTVWLPNKNQGQLIRVEIPN